MFNHSVRREQRGGAGQAWKRQRCRRPWMRSHDIAEGNALLARIPSLPRAELARIAANMVERVVSLADDEQVSFEHEQERRHD